MKMKNRLAWLLVVAIAPFAAQVGADTMVFENGGFTYDLDDYAVGSTFQDAPAAYIADATKFSGASIDDWHKDDGSDNKYFNTGTGANGSSWEWNTDAAPGEIAWTLTGLTAGVHYDLSIAGLLIDSIDETISSSDTRYLSVGTTSGSLETFFARTTTDAMGGNLPAGTAMPYDGLDKYSAYIIPFADDVVADANGEFTVYFQSLVRDGEHYRTHVDGIVVSPIPEPATLGLVMGVGGAMLFIRRKIKG